MSLKFGIYLVEQRVISAEQFCGLVKIQQESAQTMATIALRKNLMTIKQVNFVLDQMESKPGMNFEDMAFEKGLSRLPRLERHAADQRGKLPTDQAVIGGMWFADTKHQTKCSVWAL